VGQQLFAIHKGQAALLRAAPIDERFAITGSARGACGGLQGVEFDGGAVHGAPAGGVDFEQGHKNWGAPKGFEKQGRAGEGSRVGRVRAYAA
jgi:hypothetical protein